MAEHVQRAIAIPEPTNEVDSLWRTTQALKEAIEIMQGIRGNREVVLKSELENTVTSIIQISGGGGGATSLFDLSDTTLTGQSQYDLVFNADGSEWQDTAGELIWNPTADYLQLANGHSINWLDNGAVTREVIILSDVGQPDLPLERNYNEDLLVSAAAGSTSYVDLADAVITGSNFNVGDTYLVMYSAVGTNTSGSPGNNAVRLTLNDVEIPGTERLTKSGETTQADTGNMGSFVTSFVYAAGDLQGEYADGSSGSWFINGFRMTTVNLTTLGAANYTESADNSDTQIDNLGGYAATAASITIGDGVSDYLILMGVRIDTITATQTKCEVTLDINAGATLESLGDEVHDDSATLTYSAMSVVKAPSASTVLFLKGRVTAFGGTAQISNAYIIAIKLNAFEQFVTASVVDATDPSSGDNSYLITNFVSSVPTGNWGFWGYTQGLMGTSNGPITRIQANINSGGYNNVNFSNVHFQRRQGAADQGCFRFPTTDTSIANADDVDFKMFVTAASSNDDIDQIHIVAHSWVVGGSIVETVSVAHDSFATVIKGTSTNITSPIFIVDNYTFDVDQTVGAGQDNNVLTYDDATGEISLEAIPAAITHTGEVTGDVALTVDVTSITNRTDVVADSADDVAIHDDTDGSFKKVNLSSITDAGYF